MPESEDMMADNRKKVLIVDEVMGRELLVQILEDDYEVFPSDRESRCLEIVETERPDLLLIEPVLPLIRGYELIQKIRQTEAGREIAIVAITAAGMPDDEERAREAGCNAFMLKPIDEGELMEEIEALLGK